MGMLELMLLRVSNEKSLRVAIDFLYISVFL